MRSQVTSSEDFRGLPSQYILSSFHHLTYDTNIQTVVVRNYHGTGCSRAPEH